MVLKFNKEKIHSSVVRFKSIASQALACMSPNLLLLDLGMAMSFATIVVPDLLNAKEGLRFTDHQASWFGSLYFLINPLGAVLSGPLVDYYGRKKAALVVTIPHVIAWILMYLANDLPSMFIANALIGFGTGLMEAPITTYVGEITEPSLRGTIFTVTQLFAATGVLLMYYFGTVITWRTAAAISLAAPLASMALVLIVPETPVWLLSKGRQEEALKSLRYIRGWTTEENVREEFDQLQQYAEELQRCVICSKTDKVETVDCPHSKMNFFKRALLKFRYVILTKETMRPFSLIIMYFLFHIMSGFSPVRHNMVNVCGAFGMPYDGKNIVFTIGIIACVIILLIIGIIKVIGKRKLIISAMFGSGLCCAALSVYAKNNLPPSVFSYDSSTFPKELSYVPMAFFYGLIVFNSFGIPWVLIGEIFPFRSRAAAQGLAAAVNYLFTFMGAKTFIFFEKAFGIWGAYAIYAAFAFTGTIYLYFFLPETEGKTLQEIESYYSGKFRIFADDPVINLFKKRRTK